MDETNIDSGFWDKIKYMFSGPNLLFESVKKEKDIKNAVMMYSIVGAFFATLSFISLLSMQLLASAGRQSFDFGSMLLPGAAYLMFAANLVSTFIYSALIHAFVVAFKGTGKYSDSYNVYTYSLIPAMILGVIPLVGIFSWIYTIILAVNGLKMVHGLSNGKSILACILPAVLILILLVGIIASFLAMSHLV